MESRQVRRTWPFMLSALFVAGGTGTAIPQSFVAYEQHIPGSNVSFSMIPVQAGSFLMGSPETENGRDPDEGPQRKVMLSAFWIGEKEVTFAEWDLFFRDGDLPQNKDIDGVSRPTPQYIDLTWGMGRDPQHPANSMSQQGATAYCKWLYDKTGIFYRLPTEAEWEYACRAGKNNDRPFGVGPEQLNDYGYFKGNSEGRYHKTGTLKPNEWGLYDMLGNLSEWTLDQYTADAYKATAVRDPLVVPEKRYPRVVRGGSYLDEAGALRCANRIASSSYWNQRDPQMPKSEWWLTDGMFVGFRLVRPYHQPPKEEIERFFDLYLK